MNSRDDIEKVLERMSAEWPAESTIVDRVMRKIDSAPVRKQVTSRWPELTMVQRVAIGGISLSAALGLVLLVLALYPAEQVSAMERLVKELREVKSFSYRLYTQNPYVFEDKDPPEKITVKREAMSHWFEPRAMSSEDKIVHVADGEASAGQSKEKLVMHINEIWPMDQPGIVIDHLARTFIWCPALRAELVGEFSPITTVKRVREGSGKVLRDLGAKVVQGRRASGFVLALDDAAPDSGYDAVEVWVDPETDLPLEFSYERKHEFGPIIYRVTDCRWNIEPDSQVFSTRPPEGYTDTTPPAKQEDIIRIADALKLYAELSGGRYPRVTNSSGEALADEMRKMAGFAGPRKVEWADDIKYQQIEEATIALDWLSRIVRNKFQIGYRGPEVSRDNTDQVLLWWTLEEGYRVFYGDLMTEVVTEEKWSQLVATQGSQQTQDGDQE